MNIPITDWEMSVRDGHTLMIRDAEMDDDTVKMEVFNCGMGLSVDMTIDDLLRLKDLIEESVNNAFEVRPDIQCPVCGCKSVVRFRRCHDSGESPR